MFQIKRAQSKKKKNILQILLLLNAQSLKLVPLKTILTIEILSNLKKIYNSVIIF